MHVVRNDPAAAFVSYKNLEYNKLQLNSLKFS